MYGGSLLASLMIFRVQVIAGETYAPERPKCRISDVKERLHNLSGSYGVSNVNLFAFMFSWSIAIKFWCEQVAVRLKCFFSRRIYYRNID